MTVDATIKIRPFDPADTNPLRELFAQSIEYLTANEYDDEQRLAWLSAAEDGAAFENSLWDADTFVAEIAAETVGFVTLKSDHLIDMLYVHPYHVREGVGAELLDTAERLAAERGKTDITVDASDTARPFFEAHGYTATKRNLVQREDQWLSNTTMTKTLNKPKETQ